MNFGFEPGQSKAEGDTRDFGGGWLEHLRQWLGAQWPAFPPESVEQPRAVRCAQKRHRRRAQALPRGREWGERVTMRRRPR